MQKIMFDDRRQLTQAVFDERKTHTRRDEFQSERSTEFISSINSLKEENLSLKFDGKNRFEIYTQNGELIAFHKCRYSVGEIVAVAQRYRDINASGITPTLYMIGLKGWGNKMYVCADLMPRRIKIKGIRLERLQDISDEDCLREGIIITFRPSSMSFRFFIPNEPRGGYSSPREAFSVLIDKVSRRGTWKRNPWVIAYEFELLK